ncbi:hypothetical protein [Leekyejoonella antrihumi]|uniref:Uncharacterized protein n=1 Tax=Leekyejoonella antrihumi TaxID=1660198 RepID=A0A563E8H1_9MICO|nr:hypothetical protein [Leekyejoonella antrihumi]TWP38609.1 hypothetical protein FGL98_02145 [Leekyejoonella antrihumi]
MNLVGRVTRAARRLGRLFVVSAVVLVMLLLGGAPAHGGPIGPTLGPWHPVSWREVPAVTANQGVARVSRPGGPSRLVTRGQGDVTSALSAHGWWHVGDPGSRRGYLLDAYQGRPGMHAKLFVLTTPTGRRTQWIHQDVAGEMLNNSFAAIAPSGRWFVGGEWGEVGRLLVYPTPGLNPSTRDHLKNLPLAATIALTRPVRNVQGCSFSAPTVLFCATNDSRTDLFPMARQLLRIDLAHPLDGHGDLGVPHALGTVPQYSRCPGTGEIEGIDVSGPTLTVVVNEPNLCHDRSVLLTFARRAKCTSSHRPTPQSVAPPRPDDSYKPERVTQEAFLN